ncbi:hypothetical protein QTP86_029471, partial [Hemibagrus guttatus]
FSLERGIGGSVVGFSPIMRKTRVRFPQPMPHWMHCWSQARKNGRVASGRASDEVPQAFSSCPSGFHTTTVNDSCSFMVLKVKYMGNADDGAGCYTPPPAAIRPSAPPLRFTPLVRVSPRRWLNLQEYQSKKLMQECGVAVQRFFVADTATEALEAAKRLNLLKILRTSDAKEIVLKAQILAGGRGKGVFDSGLKGGVHLTKDPVVVQELANKMLGFNLTTKQTPKEGVKVNTVMVAEALDISRETYFAILMDRACNGPVMVGSPQGGVDIEEVAEKTPELIYKEVIDIFEGVRDDQALRMAANLGFKGPLERQAADQIKKLYNLFLKVDATQVEVNPLGETPEGQVVCFDAKINFDDNAEFRQKDIFAMDNTAESDPIETEAARHELKYIGLDGNIACFVNGAGLAMATCDIIDLHGGKPANFLDLGGGVKEDQVYTAFKLLSADPKVEAILVNIFGGIVNCAIIAKGITKASRELGLKVPLVVRLEGTNVQEAKRILSESGLPITSANNLDDAAEKAVAAITKK